MQKTSSFTEKITVFRKEKTRDSIGYLVNTLSELGSFYANFKFNSGSETIKSGIIANTMLSVRLRWDSKSELITQNDIIKWKDKTLNIKAVLPDMATRRYIDLVCDFGVINLENMNG